MSAALPDPLRGARRLAATALLLPWVVVALIAASSLRADARLEPARAVVRATLQVEPCLTPSGGPPRLGPGSHPAVDPRQGPAWPSLDGLEVAP